MDLRALGPLEVVSDLGETVELGGRTQRAVLAMLVINRQTLIARDRIIEAVWGDNMPADPVNTLQHYVSRLRSILEPLTGSVGGHVIHRLDEGYRFDIPAAWVDADRFADSLRAAADARRTGRAGEVDRLLVSALAEWRGEPFEDLAYFDFVQPEVRRLGELRLDAFEELFEARLALGRHQESVPELLDIANQHPLRERFWHQLMLALYRSGRQAEALRAYQQARQRLGQEIGIEPGPELATLEEQILLRDPTLQAPPTSTPLVAMHIPTSVPSPLTKFIGRHDQLDQLIDLIDERRLVTIMGTSGIGKSRLAIEVARRLLDQFDDGVRFVSLDAITNPELVGPTIAAAVQLPEDPTRNLVDALGDYLATADTLLILDGCEQVAAVCAELVARIQSRSTRLKVLATSQVALGVEGEIRIDLAPLSIDGAESDATKLFIDRASQVSAQFDPTSNELETIVRLCRVLDGSPLAIELAAARIDVLSVDQLETDLAGGTDLAADKPLPGSIRNRSLNDAISWSLRLLDDHQRKTFESLTIFAEGFNLAAANSIAFPSHSTAEVAEILAALATKSFLRVEHQKSGLPPRFQIPQALHTFCHRRFVDHHPQLAEQLSARHAAWFAELAEASDIELRGPNHQHWLRVIEADHANLRSAITWATHTNNARLLDRIVGHTARYWDWQGQTAEATRWLNQAMTINPEGDDINRGWILVWAAYFTAESGDLTGAERLAHGAIDVADQHDHTQQQTAARGNLSIILRQSGRLSDAVTVGEQAVKIAATAGDDWFHAWAATALAASELQSPNPGSAEKLGLTALETFRRLGDKGAEAWALDILAEVSLKAGELDKADSLAHDALFNAHMLGAQRTLARTMGLLAQIAYQRGELVEAVQLLSAADTLNNTPLAETRPRGTSDSLTIVGVLRELLTATEYSTAWSQGQDLDLETILNR